MFSAPDCPWRSIAVAEKRASYRSGEPLRRPKQVQDRLFRSLLGAEFSSTTLVGRGSLNDFNFSRIAHSG